MIETSHVSTNFYDNYNYCVNVGFMGTENFPPLISLLRKVENDTLKWTIERLTRRSVYHVSGLLSVLPPLSELCFQGGRQ